MPTPDGAARCSANGHTPPPAGPVGLSILASSINIISALSLSLSLSITLSLSHTHVRGRGQASRRAPVSLAPMLSPLSRLKAAQSASPVSKVQLSADLRCSHVGLTTLAHCPVHIVGFPVGNVERSSTP